MQQLLPLLSRAILVQWLQNWSLMWFLCAPWCLPVCFMVPTCFFPKASLLQNENPVLAFLHFTGEDTTEEPRKHHLCAYMGHPFEMATFSIGLYWKLITFCGPSQRFVIGSLHSQFLMALATTSQNFKNLKTHRFKKVEEPWVAALN